MKYKIEDIPMLCAHSRVWLLCKGYAFKISSVRNYIADLIGTKSLVPLFSSLYVV